MARTLSEPSRRISKLVSIEEKTFREIYEKRIQRKLFTLKGTEKDLLLAVDEKHAGYECLEKNEYKQALVHFNNGILLCPQDTDGAREVLCILIGNRTAINAEFENYDKVLDDITYLEELGKYPPTLQYKVTWRKAKCYEAMGNYQLAQEIYDETIRSLREDSGLEGEELGQKIEMVETCKKQKTSNACKASTSKEENIRDMNKFKGSKKYPAASPLVDIRYDEHQGRYAVAREDIPIGTIIVKEEPHAALLDKSRNMKNCQYCFAHVDQLVACPRCANVVFCSIACKNKAEVAFHQVECSIFPTLNTNFDKLLTLRILAQKGFEFFDEQKDRFVSLLESEYQGLTQKAVYRSDDYDNVLFLFRNINNKAHDQLYFNAAVYLLRVLKTTDFFPFETKDEVLLDEEVFIGRLILRHCRLMTYNVHGINELKYPDYDLVHTIEGQNKHLNEGIGTAIYPTLAFFNHSCEPSIMRYNDKTRVIVRAIKPISAGEIIHDNYGPNYLFMPLDQRQRVLKEDYCFQCVCTPCVDKWPMAKDLKRIVKIPCKGTNCDFIFTLTRTRRPKRCPRCRRALHWADIKQITESISVYYNEGEKFFKEKKFVDALKAFKTVLEIKYSYSKIPDLDVVKVQERIEHIFGRNGNVARLQ